MGQKCQCLTNSIPTIDLICKLCDLSFLVTRTFTGKKTVKFLTPSSSLILDRTTQKSDRPSVSSQRQTFFHVPWFLLYLTGQAADGGAKPKAQSCFKCQGYYISATKWISRTNCLSSKVMVHNYLLRKEGLWVQKKGIGWLSYVPGKWTIDVYRCNLTGQR